VKINESVKKQVIKCLNYLGDYQFLNKSSDDINADDCVAPCRLATYFPALVGIKRLNDLIV
jgi:hypothetical protein